MEQLICAPGRKRGDSRYQVIAKSADLGEYEVLVYGHCGFFGQPPSRVPKRGFLSFLSLDDGLYVAARLHVLPPGYWQERACTWLHAIVFDEGELKCMLGDPFALCDAKKFEQPDPAVEERLDRLAPPTPAPPSDVGVLASIERLDRFLTAALCNGNAYVAGNAISEEHLRAIRCSTSATLGISVRER